MHETYNTPQEDEQLSDWEIFTRIWLSPRQVFRFINDFQYDKYVIILLFLGGMARAFDKAFANNYGDTQDLSVIVLTCVVAGGLFGWLSYYIFARIISWTGQWIQGTGDSRSVLRMLSFAILPSIVSLLILLVQVAIFGVEIFKSPEEMSTTLYSGWWSYSISLVYVVLGCWTLVFFVIGNSEVQKVSIGKSILNLVIAALTFLSPIILFAGLFALMS